MQNFNNMSKPGLSKPDITDRAFWERTCPHCGEICEPKQAGRFWVPGSCDCAGAQAERELRQLEKEQREAQMRQGRLEMALDRAGLKSKLRRLTFDTFDRKAQPEAYDAAMMFFKHPVSLAFCGPVGVGKSHLGAAILNRWIRAGFDYGLDEPRGEVVGGRGFFISLAALMLRLRNTFKDGALEREAVIIEHLIRVPLLVLDDIGKEKSTEYTQQTLFNLIDSRYVQDRPIIITSNVTGTGFVNAVGTAVFSRLLEMGDIIEMQGTDYRVRKRGAVVEAEQIAISTWED